MTFPNWHGGTGKLRRQIGAPVLGWLALSVPTDKVQQPEPLPELTRMTETFPAAWVAP
jgi:hypothetical protein